MLVRKVKKLNNTFLVISPPPPRRSRVNPSQIKCTKACYLYVHGFGFNCISSLQQVDSTKTCTNTGYMYTVPVWLCLYELGLTSMRRHEQKPVICTLYRFGCTCMSWARLVEPICTKTGYMYTVQVWVYLYELGPTSRADDKYVQKWYNSFLDSR